MRNKSGGRVRSFEGCTTCRQRRLKCDEAKPRCAKCVQDDLKCGFDVKRIYFDSEAHHEGTRFRQVLFSEEERQLMSLDLIKSIPPCLVHKRLRDIDIACEDDHLDENVSLGAGPFNVFRLLAVSSSTQQEHVYPQDEPQDECIGNVLPSTMEGECSAALTPYEMTSLSSMFEADDMTLFSITDSFFTIDMSPNSVVSDAVNELSTIPPSALEITLLSSPELARSQLNNISSPPSNNLAVVLAEAVHLLNHYTKNAIRTLSPFQHSKTPWHTLFVALAKNCMASLSLGDYVDHATLCVLYGILSVSAYSLHGMYNAAEKENQADQYRTLARRHVRLMLITAYDEPKAAKYKSMLMALLTMVQLSTMLSNYDQIDCYLLEAEKLIRIKGLHRNKTRKVRSLHHCYAFERIIYESLHVQSDASDHRSHIRRAIQSSGSAVHSYDSLGFELRDWSNLEEELCIVKSEAAGENDLHLQHPGTWYRTMYPEIFGVPEHWITLLSLTVRLVRQKDSTPSALSLQDFMVRAKAIECCILKLRPPVNGDMLDHLLEAMYHALCIYFYRRVYNVDSSLLRTKVAAVQDCLSRYRMAAPDHIQASARMVWPVYIAACEADQPNYDIFTEWLEQTARTTGFTLFNVALDNVKRIRTSKLRTGST